jgi:hypothetical protein
VAAKKEQLTVTVMIEIPKGSRNKYEYDKEKRVLRFDRMLFSAVHYPSDYGFIPDTLAQDGDPLDALVLVWEPTFPGCLIEASAVELHREPYRCASASPQGDSAFFRHLQRPGREKDRSRGMGRP